MPPPTSGKLRCGITFDENKSPLDKVGLQGVWEGEPTHSGALRPLSLL